MTLHWSAATGGFYDTGVFRSDLPVDAVEITPARHAALMDALCQGRILVAGAQGQPLVAPVVAPTLEDRRAAAIDGVRTEAQRRILNVAPLWRQSNDAAAIAAHSWRPPADLTLDEADALALALGRRGAIDVIRARSDVLEATIAAMSAEQVLAIDIRSDIHWI